MRGPPPSRFPGRRKPSRRPKQLFHPPTLNGDGASRPRFVGPLNRNFPPRARFLSTSWDARAPSAIACVFFLPAPVLISSMNATAFYFESSMAQESTEIARGLRRRDPDLLDRLIEQYQHRLLRYLVYLTGRRELAEDLVSGNLDPRARTRSPVQRQIRIQHLALRRRTQPGNRSHAPQTALQPRRFNERK